MADSDEETSTSKDPSMPPLEPKKQVGRIRGVNTTASRRNLMELKLAGDKAYKEKQQRLREEGLLAKASSNAASDDEEEEESVAPVEKPKAKGGRPKGSKNKKGTVEKGTTTSRSVFAMGDDYVLAKAWINCSETSVKGAGQKSSDFWQSISETYIQIVEEGDYPMDKYKVNVPDWKAKPLKQRFAKVIHPQVMKFNAAYYRIKALNESGKTEEDYIRDALAEYKLTSDGNKDFKFLHLCAGLLWDTPKFSPKAPTAQDDDDGSNALYGDLGGNEDNDRSSVNRVSDSMQGATMKRPIGSKAAKRVLAEAHTKDFYHKQKMKRMDKMADASMLVAKGIFKTYQFPIDH
jgi:hypothetical protein